MSQEAAIINPPSQRGRHHAKSLTEVLELRLGKKLREIICNLVFYRKVLRMYCLPLHHVSNIMISLTNQVYKEFVKPHCFANCHPQYYLFLWYSRHISPFPATPGSHGRSQGKATPGGVLQCSLSHRSQHIPVILRQYWRHISGHIHQSSYTKLEVPG